jgi:hypothetical protein
MTQVLKDSFAVGKVQKGMDNVQAKSKAFCIQKVAPKKNFYDI